MPGVQDNAEQVREKAFQSMQDSLDKIEKNTSSLGVLSGTIEEIMEENKAQRVRDKEQEKQTDALEKISKNSQEGMSTWNKVLIGVVAVGIGIWAIHDLMKGRWPWNKDKDPIQDPDKVKKATQDATTLKGWQDAFKRMQKNERYEENWFTKLFGIENRGTPVEDFVGAFEGTQKIITDLPKNITDQGRRLGNAWKDFKTSSGEKLQRTKSTLKNIFGGGDDSVKADKKANKARETLRSADNKRQRLLNQRREQEQKNQAQEDKNNKKNIAKKMSALKAEGEQQRKDANSRDKLNKATKIKGAETEKNRLRQIKEGGKPGSSSVTKQAVSQAQDHAKGIKRPPPAKIVTDETKKKFKTGVKWGTKAMRIWRVTQIAGASMGPYVGAAALLGMTALEYWVAFGGGEEVLAEHNIKIEDVAEKMKIKLLGPLSKAKSFTSAPLDATGRPKKQVASTFGQAQPEKKPGMLEGLKKWFIKKTTQKPKDEALSETDYNAMKIAIGKRESLGAKGGQLRAKNKYGYRGKYQFGAQALESIGFLKAGTWKKGPRDNKKLMENSSNWIGGTDKNGNPLPKSLEAYLSSEEMQDLAFHKNALFNRKVMRGKGGIGMETWNSLSKEERAFMVGAAHISGAASTVSQFNKGDFGKKDAFGTESSVMGNIAARAVNQTGQALQSIRPEMGGTGSGGATQVNINAPTSSNASNVLVFGNGPHAPAIDNGLSFGFKGQMDTSKGN